jgi:hypothetical protein
MPQSPSLSAAALARIHTALALAAFLSALLVGCALHYTRIVKNDVAGYPAEWLPSVSATCVRALLPPLVRRADPPPPHTG